jgi:hypothetical protein
MATNPRSPAAVAETAASVQAPAHDRPWSRLCALAAIAIFLGAGLWLLRWSGGDSTATPDTFWYARDALKYAGYSQSRADAAAARITCGAMSRAHPHPRDFDSCLAYRTTLPASAPVRFQRIFTSRPGYALLTTPFVKMFGGAGFVVGTAALGVACGAAIVGLALATGLRPVQALLAEIAFYLLPTGLWTSRMLAEPPMMLCLLTVMIGTVLLLRGRYRIAATGLLATGLAVLCVTKPANGMALAAALAAGSVVLLPFTRSRSACLIVAGVAAIVLTGNLWVSATLHLPGFNETLQDTFTQHFRHPDVPGPWHRLADRTGWLWREPIRWRMLDDPLIPVAYLLGAYGLVQKIRPAAAWMVCLAGLTGAVVVSMHPLVSEMSRLTVVTWIPVALGLAALVALPLPSRTGQDRLSP